MSTGYFFDASLASDKLIIADKRWDGLDKIAEWINRGRKLCLLFYHHKNDTRRIIKWKQRKNRQ